MRQQLDDVRSESARERQQARADIAKLEEENATYRREVARLSAAADAASASQRKLDVRSNSHSFALYRVTNDLRNIGPTSAVSSRFVCMHLVGVGTY